MSLYKFEQVTKSYKKHNALDEFSWQIEEGKIQALLGHNGAGKTTAFMIANKVIPFEKGSVLFRDKPLSKMTKSDIQKVGFLTEKLKLYDETNEENDTPPEADPVKKEFEIVISVDDKTQIPEPYSNFLLASNSDNGDLSNTWFDFEEKEGKYIVSYYQSPGKQNYIEGYVRNMNGDANLIIKPISLSTEKLELNFTTPKTASENNINWSDITKSKLNDLLASNNLSEQKSIVLVLNQEGNEPQERMLEQLINKLPDFTNKNINVLVYSQNRVIPRLVNLTQDKFFYQSASRIVEEDISLDNYPVIFLMDKGNIITSANGFDLDLINYLYRLVD